MRIEEEKMWTEANKEDYLYDLMGTLRPNRNVGERETTRVKIRVSEEMYIIMSDMIKKLRSLKKHEYIENQFISVYYNDARLSISF